MVKYDSDSVFKFLDMHQDMFISWSILFDFDALSYSMCLSQCAIYIPIGTFLSHNNGRRVRVRSWVQALL